MNRNSFHPAGDNDVDYAIAPRRKYHSGTPQAVAPVLKTSSGVLAKLFAWMLMPKRNFVARLVPLEIDLCA